MSRSRKVIFWFTALALFHVAALGFWSCSKTEAGVSKKKVIVIGFDGTDPQLLQKFMDQGRLPNFSRLAKQGDFKALGTSIPPQSPVAWSNFITGMNPGGHGIYDFLHRDPNTMTPIPSTSATEGAARTLKIGKFVIPLSGGEVKNLRKGRAFWTELEDRGIETTVFKVPANYPPVDSKGKSLSGMGTVDLLGSFGTFSFYTDDPPPNRDDISGGVVYPVEDSDQGEARRFRTVKSAAVREAAVEKHGLPELHLDVDIGIARDFLRGHLVAMPVRDILDGDLTAPARLVTSRTGPERADFPRRVPHERSPELDVFAFGDRIERVLVPGVGVVFVAGLREDGRAIGDK